MKLNIFQSINEIPRPPLEPQDYEEWSRGNDAIRNALQDYYVVYDSPKTTPTFDVNLLDDQMNHWEFCIAVSRLGRAYNQDFIKILLRELGKLRNGYYVSLVQVTDTVGDLPFYLKIYSDRIYCVPFRGNCVSELGLNRLS